MHTQLHRDYNYVHEVNGVLPECITMIIYPTRDVKYNYYICKYNSCYVSY